MEAATKNFSSKSCSVTMIKILQKIFVKENPWTKHPHMYFWWFLVRSTKETHCKKHHFVEYLLITASTFVLSSAYEASIVSEINLVPLHRKIFKKIKIKKIIIDQILAYMLLLEKCKHFCASNYRRN